AVRLAAQPSAAGVVVQLAEPVVEQPAAGSAFEPCVQLQPVVVGEQHPVQLAVRQLCAGPFPAAAAAVVVQAAEVAEPAVVGPAADSQLFAGLSPAAAAVVAGQPEVAVGSAAVV